MNDVGSRKQKEAEFHNKVRDEKLKDSKVDYKNLTSNKKFYRITRKSNEFVNNWLLERCPNKKVLDYCCGNGEKTIYLAKKGADAVGIDISATSIENAKKSAILEGVGDSAVFFVMDAETTQFPDGYFDFIACLGVLHHLDTKKAFRELARILKPEGQIICDEPLVYNPVFQLYRKITPRLRTQWEAEHILSKKDFHIAEDYFDKIEIRFFHLTTLAAVPFRNLPGFSFLLGILEKLDLIILRLPFLKWWAWQTIFILSYPRDKNM